MSEPAPFDMPPPTASFEARGGWVLNRLVADLGITAPQAAGIVGNLGGESGLKAINERHPMVPGSQGGFGWAQWTGPRRRAFETETRSWGLLITDDQANYQFLVYELLGSERRALQELKRQMTVEAATESFLRRFERPADPDGALPGRIEFAWRALTGAGAVPEPALPAPDRAVTIAIIKAMQTALVPYGYEGEIDGDPGPGTLRALTKWRTRV